MLIVAKIIGNEVIFKFETLSAELRLFEKSERRNVLQFGFLLKYFRTTSIESCVRIGC